MGREEMEERHPFPPEMLLLLESSTLVFQTVQVTPSGRAGGQLCLYHHHLQGQLSERALVTLGKNPYALPPIDLGLI